MIDSSIIHEVLSDLDLNRASIAASGNLRVRGSKFHFAAAFAVIALVGSLLFSLLGTSDWAKPDAATPLATSAAAAHLPNLTLGSDAVAKPLDEERENAAPVKQADARQENAAVANLPDPIPESEVRLNEPVPENIMTITVQPNDTLRLISQRYLRQKLDKQLCDAILRLNPQISNEDIILSGGKLRIPSPALRANTAESLIPGQMQSIEQEKKP